MGIRHQREASGDTLRVELGDAFNVVEVEAFLQQVEADLAALRRISFNLSTLTVLDSAALGQLVHIHQQLRQRAPELSMTLEQCPDLSRRLLEIARLDELFEVS